MGDRVIEVRRHKTMMVVHSVHVVLRTAKGDREIIAGPMMTPEDADKAEATLKDQVALGYFDEMADYVEART